MLLRRFWGHVWKGCWDIFGGILSGVEKIFERFYRVDKGRSRKLGGTGLGLAIVKHAIDRNNARIEIESKLGFGSTFSIIFPKVNVK